MQLSLVPLTDLAGLRVALAEAELPVSDLTEAGRRFWSCRTPAGQIVGYAGLEAYGADALLRSVVILPQHRDRKYGRAIVNLIRAEAMTHGIRRLWLLTLSSDAFFRHLGFTGVPRDSIPATIANSLEFKSICPDSAMCMRADLAD